MRKKIRNQAEQELRSMPVQDRIEFLQKFNAMKWHYFNGKCHAIRNPYVKY